MTYVFSGTLNPAQSNQVLFAILKTSQPLLHFKDKLHVPASQLELSLPWPALRNSCSTAGDYQEPHTNHNFVEKAKKAYMQKHSCMTNSVQACVTFLKRKKMFCQTAVRRVVTTEHVLYDCNISWHGN